MGNDDTYPADNAGNADNKSRQKSSCNDDIVRSCETFIPIDRASIVPILKILMRHLYKNKTVKAIRKGDKIMEDKEQIGYFAKIKVAKNKIFAPFKTAELPIKWNMGYDKTTDIIEAALILKLISKAGAFYTVGSEKLQGKEKLAKYLEGEEKIRANLEKEIQSKIKDMRMGKKVLDDEALNKMEAIIEEESQSVEEE